MFYHLKRWVFYTGCFFGILLFFSCSNSNPNIKRQNIIDSASQPNSKSTYSQKINFEEIDKMTSELPLPFQADSTYLKKTGNSCNKQTSINAVEMDSLMGISLNPQLLYYPIYHYHNRTNSFYFFYSVIDSSLTLDLFYEDFFIVIVNNDSLVQKPFILAKRYAHSSVIENQESILTSSMQITQRSYITTFAGKLVDEIENKQYVVKNGLIE